MRAELHPKAEEELQAAARWYDARVLGLGVQFLAKMLEALEAVERNPRLYAKSGRQGTREIP